MERCSDRAIEIIDDLHTERLDYESEYIPLIDCANQCAAYEDTGLTPEDVRVYKDAEEQGLLVRLTERLALAMCAGARAIENNRRYESATYVYDVFQVGKELFYREAARLLREEAEKALEENWNG